MSAGCCPSDQGQDSMICCSCERPPSGCCPQSVVCRPTYPTRCPPRPTKTTVYLRPNPLCPPCCPMPCPPKIVVTTYPRVEPPAPPPPRPFLLCTMKRIPVMPPPPPTAPISSPCRPTVVPCPMN